MDLNEVKELARGLSPWAHLATVGADGKPDVSPVNPCWEDDVLWVMVGVDSVKSRNIAVNPNVALHWQVTEQGDGMALWGTAQLYDDLGTKRRLWKGVFDYDLDLFAPGGPEGSVGTGFLAIRPERALFLKTYGIGGAERWHA
jgi:general stress protein 26